MNDNIWRFEPKTNDEIAPGGYATIKYNDPKPLRVQSWSLGIKEKFHEIRIYSDSAQVRIYKPKIIAKLNKEREETGKITIDFLPKRVKKATRKWKITVI